MNIRSRRSLTESVAGKQISALINFSNGLMRPDKCSEFEPIRTPFDPADISKPIQWLARPHGEFFYRKGRPTYVSGQMWNHTHSPAARFPSPLFTNYWTGQFDGYWAKRVGIEKIESFVLEMFRVTGSDFGFLTSEIDRNAKNQPAPNCSYQGLDPATGVPGLYWTTFFSEEYATWLGLRELPKELATLKELAGGGISLKFCESPDDCRSLEVLQNNARQSSGSDRRDFLISVFQIASRKYQTGVAYLYEARNLLPRNSDPHEQSISIADSISLL